MFSRDYPPDVMDFCLQHKCIDKLDLVVEQMKGAFPDAQRIVIGMEDDPESTDRGVLVDVVVAGGPKEIRLRHSECMRRLLPLLPWPEVTLIRST